MTFKKFLSAVMACVVLSSCAPEKDQHSIEQMIANLKWVNSSVEPEPDGVAYLDRSALLAEVRAGNGPVPEIVLLEWDPWIAVPGSESPRFALYENGQVIYREGDHFSSVVLDGSELSALRQSLKSAHDPNLSGYYRVSRWTDASTSELLFYTGQPVYISVYGSVDDERVSALLPPQIPQAMKVLRSYSHPRAARWLPAEIEVMIWPYEYAPEESIHWKADWPSLADPKTVRRGDDSYSLYLPSDQLDQLRAFLATENEKGAVEIDGKKWAVSYRFPFPHEELWLPSYLESEASLEQEVGGD